jgi:hypothetical protein
VQISFMAQMALGVGYRVQVPRARHWPHREPAPHGEPVRPARRDFGGEPDQTRHPGRKALLQVAFGPQKMERSVKDALGRTPRGIP